MVVIKQFFRFVCIFFCICLTIQADCYALQNYPIKFSVINKTDAKYDTPENAFIAKKSALINHDLEWYYESLSTDTVKLYKQLFSKNNIDPSKIFDTVNRNDITIIYGKQIYKDGVILLVETTTPAGITLYGPVVLVQEDGLWKTTVKYRADNDLKQYFEVIKPEFQNKFSLMVYPSKWNISLDNGLSTRSRIKKATFQDHKISVLMVISPKENAGVSLTEILPETLRLNRTVLPTPWPSFRYKRAVYPEEYAHIILSPKDCDRAERKKFGKWWGRLPDKIFDRPVMLVRFDMHQSVQSLLEMNGDEECEVSLTGKLKNGSQFKTTASIILVDSKSGKGNKRKHHRPRFH